MQRHGSTPVHDKSSGILHVTVLDLYPTEFVISIEPSRFEPKTKCWLHVGPYHREGGYPLLEYGGKWWAGNRLAMKLAGKPLGDHEMACHTCDNKPCCNPEHLFAGSNSINQLDRIKWSATLTPEAIEAIRSNKTLTDTHLAKLYKVTRSQIHWLRSRNCAGVK